MPSYRLVTGYGAPVETFDAADDVEAGACARELAHRYTRSWPPDHTRRSDFGLQRRTGDRWTLVTAWVPRLRAQTDGLRKPEPRGA